MEFLSAFSVFLGSISALLLLSTRAVPLRWARLLADAGRESGRPAWAWALISGSLAGVAALWYLHFTAEAGRSLLIALLGTILLVRAVQVLISKDGLKEASRSLLRGQFSYSYLSYALISAALIVLGLL